MIEFIVLAILWYCVACLTVQRLNEVKDEYNDWPNIGIWEKLWIVTVTPVVYLYLNIVEVFKK